MNSVESAGRVYRYRCSRCPNFYCFSREELISHNSEYLHPSRQEPPTSKISLDEMSKGHSIESKGSNDIKDLDSIRNSNHKRNSNSELAVAAGPRPPQHNPNLDLGLDHGFKPHSSKECPKMSIVVQNMQQQHFDQNESHHLAKNELRRRMKIIRKRGFTSLSAPTLKNRTCSYCKKVLCDVRARRDHERIHLNQKPFSCTMCQMKFHSDSSLRNHLRRTCNKRKTIAKAYANSKEVFKNKNVDINQNYISGKEITRTSENFATVPVSRAKTQNTLEPNTCPYCYRKLTNVIALGDHIRSQHTGEKPFHCHRCSEGFHSKKALGTHLRHQQLRCRRNKRIGDRQGQSRGQPRQPSTANLKASEKVACPHCGRICARQQTLDDHIRSKHTGETPFKCDDCGYGFHTKRTLESHQMRFQGKCEGRYKPNVRDYHLNGSIVSSAAIGVNKPKIKNQNEITKTTSISNRNETSTPRKLTHQIAVDTRDIDPIKNMPVLSRMGIQPVENFSCPYCKKLMTSRLNLIAHIRLHTGEKPFECSDCKARFFNLNTLNKHRENKQCLFQETQIKVEKSTVASTRASASKPMAVIGPNQLQQQHLLVKAKSPVASGSGSDDVNTGTRPLPLRRGPGPLSRTVRAEVTLPTSQGVISASNVPETNPGNPTPYVCPLCEKVMTSEVNLESHVRLHTGEKPFSCLKCEATFYSQKSLNNHKRVGGTRCWQLKRRRYSRSYECKKINPGPSSDAGNSSRTIDLKKSSESVETNIKIAAVSVPSRRSSRALTDAELEVAVNAESEDDEDEEQSENSRKMSLRARPAQKRSKYVDLGSEDEDSSEDEDIVVNTNVNDKKYDINQTNNTTKVVVTTSEMENTCMALPYNPAHVHASNYSPNGKSCPFCQQTYPTDILLEHIRAQHLNDRPFQCILCDASFRLHGELVKHKVEFHRISRNKLE